MLRQVALCLVPVDAERRQVAQRSTMSARQQVNNTNFSDNQTRAKLLAE